MTNKTTQSAQTKQTHSKASGGGVPAGWQEVKFSDFCEITRGGSPRPIHDYISTNGTPWVKIADATESNSRYITKTKEFIKPEGESKSRVVYPGDFIVSNSATPGLPRFMKIRACIHDGWLLLRDIKDVNKEFLYYLILVERRAILAQGSGTIFTNLKTDILKNHKILLPPLPEQKAIAEVLSSLDDKIDLLHRQNKTLEDMAQALFRKWFVDEADEGWEEKRLGEVVEVISGYSYKGKELVEGSRSALVTLKNFGRDGSFQKRGFKPFIGTPKESQKVKIGDLIVAHTDLTQNADVLGNPALIFEDGGFNDLFITMDLVKVVSKDKNITIPFLYFLMKTREFKTHCVANSNGSTVLHLSKKAVPDFIIQLPSKGMPEKKRQYFDDVVSKIQNNQSQIRTLENLRDTLLPKLMSGEVRVKDFTK